MENYLISNEAVQSYSEALALAKKQSVGLLKRFSNPIEDSDTEKLTKSNSEEFNPEFSYPELYDLDSEEIQRKINIAQGRLSSVNQAELDGYTPTVSDEFDKEKAVRGIMNLKLLKTAQDIQKIENDDERREKLVCEFMELNEDMWGTVDEDLYQGIINSVHEIADKIPQEHTKAKELADELIGKLPQKTGENSISSLPEEVFEKYKDAYRILFGEWAGRMIIDDLNIYDAEAIRHTFSNALTDMDLAENGWKVEVKEEIDSIKVDYKNQTVSIPSRRRLTRPELAKKLVHEVGHIIRGWNGAEISKMAANGLPDYLDAEEGLMSFGEEFISGKRQPNITYIERYLGVGSMMGVKEDGMNDFKEVFSRTWRLRALMNYQNSGMEDDVDDNDIHEARKESLINTKRLFRGGDGSTPGLGWTKDKVYYEGYSKLMKVLERFHNEIGIENLDWLFIAKYDPTNSLHAKYLELPFKA